MKYNVYCNGHYFFETNDILRAVIESKKLIAKGVERSEIVVFNEDGHVIGLQF